MSQQRSRPIKPSLPAAARTARFAPSPQPLPATQVRLRWLLTSLGLLVLVALCCAYLSLCLLFAQGSWQLLYQPGHIITMTPAAAGLAFTPVRFGVNESGVTELSGWWIPADSPSAPTILYLHDSRGTLSDTLSALTHLHTLGCSVLAIDYRGFGMSASAHPSEQSMVDDALTAIHYLEDIRHVPQDALALWGEGTGSTIAAEAAGSHPFPIVLQAMRPAALELLSGEERLRLLPVRFLMKDRLNPLPSLQSNSAPKLFLSSSTSATEDPTFRYYMKAAGPKELSTPSGSTQQRLFLTNALKHLR